MEIQKKKKRWKPFTEATDRKACGFRRNLPPHSERNTKTKITVPAKKPVGTTETARNA